MNIGDTSSSRAGSLWRGLLFAVVATALALAARLTLFETMLGTRTPFLFFYISLAASAWYGGFPAGMLATVLGSVAGAYYFMSPRFSLYADRPLDHLETLIFILTGAFMSFLYGSLITARRRVEAEAAERRRAEASLSAADRRKDEFLATLAHELRNPLAPISNSLEILRRAKDDKTKLKTVAIIERQLRQMVHLVEDLMDVARITQNKIVLRKRSVLIGEAVQNAIDSVKSSMDEKHQRLEVSFSPAYLRVNGDMTRLTQIFTNILANASKYSDDGGAIRVTTDADNGHVRIAVQDEGIGISAEALPKVFRMFEQDSAVIDRSQGGLGIGLGLVKRLVEMHDGTVTAASAGPGRGSEFVVTLPLIEQEEEAPAAAAQETAPTVAHYRILIVDDSVDSALTLGWLLEAQGHEVKSASDGPSAIAAVGSFVPDFILLDIGLPGMNGYEVCKKLRQLPQLKDTAIIAQTGFGQPQDFQRSKETGFDAHLVKPVTIEALEKIFQNLHPLHPPPSGTESRGTPSQPS